MDMVGKISQVAVVSLIAGLFFGFFFWFFQPLFGYEIAYLQYARVVGAIIFVASLIQETLNFIETLPLQ